MDLIENMYANTDDDKHRKINMQRNLPPHRRNRIKTNNNSNKYVNK